MKIAPNNLSNFISNVNNNKNICAILIYGPDQGLVHYRKQQLIKSILGKDKNQAFIIDFEYNKIKSNVISLHDELRSQNIFKQKKLIIIDNCTNSINKDLSQVITNNPKEYMIICCAADLPPSSSFRKLFDSNKDLASIACYKDEEANIKQIIEKKFKEAGYSYDYHVIQLLSEKFYGDRLIILNEIDKLITYMGDNKNITIDDAQNAIADNKELAINNLCNDIFSLNHKNIENNNRRALLEEVQPITIVRSLINYLLKLHFVKLKIESGTPEHIAINELKPPIFFKQLPIFKRHLHLWNIKKLYKILDGLIKLEKDCKSNLQIPQLLYSRFVNIVSLTNK